MKQKILLLLLIALLLPFGLWAQNEFSEVNKDAEKLFSYYFPLAITPKYQNVLWDNSAMDSPITHKSKSVWSPALGLEYSFLQKNQFNFKLGFFIRHMRRETYTAYNSDYYPPYGYAYDFLESPYWTYHIPITIEHITYFSKTAAVAFHFGYELQVYGITPGIETYKKTGLSQGNNSVVSIIATEREHQKALTSGINFGIGIYKRTGPGLIKIEANYHLHFKSLITEEVHIIDKISNKDVYSSNIWTGDYYGISISYYPIHKRKR